MKFLMLTLSVVLAIGLAVLFGVTIWQATRGEWLLFALDTACLLVATPAMILVVKVLIKLFRQQ